MTRDRAVASALGLALAASCGLAGCFTSAADFGQDAEDFILNDDGLAESLGVTFATATCEQPDSQDVGTTFTCNAVDDAGDDWEFDIEIQESNNYTVNVSRFPS